MTYHNLDNITEFSGETRKFYDGKIKLGKKLNVFNVNPQLKRHLAYRGMRHINLIAQCSTSLFHICCKCPIHSPNT